MIRDNISRIEGQIAAVCKRLGRDPSEIVLVGVTKTAEADKIKEAVEAGLRHIGENRVQEGQRKFPLLDAQGVKVTKHLIGHLQTNKVKYVLNLFDMIQSVDSLKLAEEIEKQAEKFNKDIDILIQVSTSGEEQKFGADPKDVFPLLEAIPAFKHIYVRGLMTIAPDTEDKAVVQKCFRDLRVLRDQIQQRYSGSDKIVMKYLSMGMSQDYEIALEEGANMLRIGRAIFAE